MLTPSQQREVREFHSVECNCGMYRVQGYCYHTGYRPNRYVSKPVIPRAILRMERWVRENPLKG